MTAAASETRTARQRRVVREPQPAAVEAVLRVRRELHLRELEDIDVALIAAHYRLTPMVADLENEEAHLIRAGARGIVCIARRVWETGAWRFPFAHELGHWLLDDGHDDLRRCTAPGKTRARRNVESAASDFAGLLVVPEDVIPARFDLRAPDLETVTAIAVACAVSAPVAALRVLQMTRAPRAVALSVAGRVSWWAETAAFGERVRAGRRVPEGSAAARLHGARWEGASEEAGPSWDDERVGSAAVRVGGREDAVVSWLG
jgi:hypothetical protein